MIRQKQNDVRRKSMVPLLLLIVMALGYGCATHIVHPVSRPPGVFQTSADDALAAGNYDQAELILDRALRVEPRRADYWHAMGRVRFGQRQYEQAVQFCLKSNSLAGKDGALVQRNYELIAESYARMGESAKAEQARKNASGRF